MNADALAILDDPALVSAVAAGRQPALAELYGRHAPAVHGLARRLLGDGALAEDVTQEIFVRLWRQPERFDPNRGKLRTLLLTQTHGLAVDLIRRERARSRREERVHHEPKAPPPDIDAELITLIEVEQVRSALDALDDDTRAAIELAFYGGHTYREVAAILDVPEGTIKSRIRTGLKRLQALLPTTDGWPSPPPTSLPIPSRNFQQSRTDQP